MKDAAPPQDTVEATTSVKSLGWPGLVGIASFIMAAILTWLSMESRDSYFTDGCQGWWSWYPALMLAAAAALLIGGVCDLMAAGRAKRGAVRAWVTVLGVGSLGLGMLFLAGMVGVLIAVADFSVGC